MKDGIDLVALAKKLQALKEALDGKMFKNCKIHCKNLASMRVAVGWQLAEETRARFGYNGLDMPGPNYKVAGIRSLSYTAMELSSSAPFRGANGYIMGGSQFLPSEWNQKNLAHNHSVFLTEAEYKAAKKMLASLETLEII